MPLLALLSFLAPSSTMLPRWILCKFLLQLPLLLLLPPLPIAVPSLATHPLPLLPMSIALHFVVVDTRAGSQQGNLIVDSPLFCLTHSHVSLSLSPALFLDFYALLVPCPFHICFRVFWWLAKFNFNSICSQQQQQQQQREQPLISWLRWKALKSMLQISVCDSLSFLPLSLCGLKLIGILQLTR